MNHRGVCVAACLFTWLVAVHPHTVLGDLFYFKDGRVLAGRVANKSQEKVGDTLETVWAVELEPGTFIKIYESSLEDNGRQPLKDGEQEYFEKVKSIPETAEAHFLLAGWCTANKLHDLAKAHYLRVLDIEPNHGNARATLGFTKDENGRWVVLNDVMREKRGKVQFKGRWQFPESVALERAKEERLANIAAATKDIFRWHNDAIRSSGNRQAQALENLNKVEDPLSSLAFAELLQGSKRPNVVPAPLPMRLLYVQLLGRLQTFDAAQALSHASVTDADSQVRNAALDQLQTFGREVAQPIYLNYLNSEVNAYVNLAAEGLGQLGGEECVLPLISALNTSHKQKSGGGNPNVSTQGLAFGGKEKIEWVEYQNPGVLGTLSQMTRQNFNFDENAWMSWYASIYAPPAQDLRRDP